MLSGSIGTETFAVEKSVEPQTMEGTLAVLLTEELIIMVSKT